MNIQKLKQNKTFKIKHLLKKMIKDLKFKMIFYLKMI